MHDTIFILAQAFILWAGFMGLFIAWLSWTADHRAIVRAIKRLTR